MYTLWVYPDLLPAFSTWPPVLQKLAGGAGKRTRTLSSRIAKNCCLQDFYFKLSFPVAKMYLKQKSVKNTYAQSNSWWCPRKENNMNEKKSRFSCLNAVTCSTWESRTWKYILRAISSSELGRRTVCVIGLFFITFLEQLSSFAATLLPVNSEVKSLVLWMRSEFIWELTTIITVK